MLIDVYLIGITVFAVLVRATGAVRPARWLDKVTVPAARHLLGSVVGLSLAVTTVHPPTAAWATSAELRPAATATTGADTTGADTTGADISDISEEPPLLRRRTDPLIEPAPSPSAVTRLDPPPTPIPSETALLDPPLPPPAVIAPPDRATPDRATPDRVAPDAVDVTPTEDPAKEQEHWHVTSGDHLWGIAEATVEAHVGGPAKEATVRRYWRRLIAENRNRLVDPDNADLIFPGQVFHLPPFDG